MWLSQPCKAILAQVQMNPSVPIHTIAFNCNDEEANCFLYQLANSTRGRYHYYTDNDYDVEPPESWKVSHFLSLYGIMQDTFSKYIRHTAEWRRSADEHLKQYLKRLEHLQPNWRKCYLHWQVFDIRFYYFHNKPKLCYILIIYICLFDKYIIWSTDYNICFSYKYLL